MKKFISTDLGGAPINKSDLKEVFNSEIWDAMQALLSAFDSDTEGIIVSGCVISGAGPYAISTGIVYLGGEFRRLPAQTGVTLPKYIAAKATVNDSRTFADGTSHAVVATKDAELVASAPGTQYIAITSTTDPDNRRYYPTIGSPRTLKKLILVNDWNMDTTSLYIVPHGVTDSDILAVTILIQDNVIGKFVSFTDSYTISSGSQGYFVINDTEIELSRLTGGQFDNSFFVNTPIKIFIEYLA